MSKGQSIFNLLNKKVPLNIPKPVVHDADSEGCKHEAAAKRRAAPSKAAPTKSRLPPRQKEYAPAPGGGKQQAPRRKRTEGAPAAAKGIAANRRAPPQERSRNQKPANQSSMPRLADDSLEQLMSGNNNNAQTGRSNGSNVPHLRGMQQSGRNGGNADPTDKRRDGGNAFGNVGRSISAQPTSRVDMAQAAAQPRAQTGGGNYQPNQQTSLYGAPQQAQQQQYGGGGMDSSRQGVSSNVFASGSNQNCGNIITDRATTRVTHAPGGASQWSISDAGAVNGAAKANASQFKASFASMTAPGAMPAMQQAQQQTQQQAQQGGALGGVSSNRYANGANQNVGNMISDRSTTRVMMPPGGASSGWSIGGY
jgi:hypothetical protein